MKGHYLAFAAIAAALFVCSIPGALAQNQCCLYATPGPANPADHTWQFDPANPDAPNLMMHARICMRCPAGASAQAFVTGVKLTASGTGNDATDIGWIRVSYDVDCNGTPDVPLAQTTGGYPVDDGTISICNPSAGANVPPVSPDRCICLVIEYTLRPTAPCGATYQFVLSSILVGPNCNAAPLCTDPGPLVSAKKTVICDQPCCLEASYGPHQPADHTFNCVPGTVPGPNFMMDLRICNPCPTPQPIYGLVLQAGGTGNPASVQSVSVYLDADCDGKPDTTSPPLTGTVGADGVVNLCSTTGVPLVVLGPPGTPDNCACFLVYYQMNCPAAPGTYFFNVTQLLGPNCEPVCVNGLPLKSATKTVEECCLEVSKGPGFPPDHNFECVAGTPVQPNLMGIFRICNPCPTTQCISGIVLKAGGTGNDLTGISGVRISIDRDCDGKPEQIGVFQGAYGADDGTLTFCNAAAGGPALCLQPGQCVCIRVEYLMKCDAPAGTYYFDIVSLLGPNCQPVCAKVLPIRSATKTVVQKCCLDVVPGPGMPPDHAFTCPPTGAAAPNYMQQVQICNPCPTPVYVYGVKLQAYGSGNDATGIQAIAISVDTDCDGKPDATQPPTPTGTYASDNGTATLCGTAPFMVLAPYQCACINIYYQMKCPNPVPGTYAFTLTDILGPNCQPLCVFEGLLPIKSAVKSVDPKPCCLNISAGPNNPPSHYWFPGLPKRNRMFQFQICNPCPDTAVIKCLTLQASGTGNDSADLLGVRVVVDSNCDGVWQPGEPTVGVASYSVDNGSVTFNPSSITIPPGQCKCFLVEYLMRNTGRPGSTYCMTLTNVCATNAATGADFCKDGLPLRSNCKTRCWKVGHVRFAQPGWKLCLPIKVITAVLPDRFYIQDLYGDTNDSVGSLDEYGLVPDRSAGVAVMGAPPAGASVGSIVDVEGTAGDVGCEVTVNPTSVAISASPFFGDGSVRTTNRNVGGGSLGMQPAMVDSFFDVFAGDLSYSQQTSNVGLLQVTWGRVTSSVPGSHFYIDDGSNLRDGTTGPDGSPNTGIRVKADLIPSPPLAGQVVSVRGVASAMTVAPGVCARLLIPRNAADIVQLAP